MIRIGAVNIDTSHPLAFSEYLLKGNRARYVAVYNDGFRVLPAAADTITVGAATTTASTGHIDDATVGECIDLELVAANKWFATMVYGTHWVVT